MLCLKRISADEYAGRACPFCKDATDLYLETQKIVDSKYMKYAQVICDNCGACGPPTYFDCEPDFNSDEDNCYDDRREVLERAVAMWEGKFNFKTWEIIK